jgi:hypothetical protein
MFKSLTSILDTKLISSPTQELSENIISLHHQALSELRIFGLMMKALDNPGFHSPDFIFYIRFKSHLKNQYKHLKEPAELLRIFIQARDSLLKIKQIELRYHTPKQKEYYDFVAQLLGNNFDRREENDLEKIDFQADNIQNNKYLSEEFKTNIKEKLNTIIPTLESEQGKKPLQEYVSHLEVLASEKEFGLKVLYILKKSQFQLTDFALIKAITIMVNDLQNKNLKNRSKMLNLVKENNQVFEQIGKIIGLSEQQLHEENYGILLQYLCLSKIHQLAYDKYANLIEILTEWENFYNVLNDIRQQYPLTQFKIPADFKKNIIGLDIYKKYKVHLNLNK